MFNFILKFISSIIKTQKVRTAIVLCGMTICSFFVLGFFYFSSVGAVPKEEHIEHYFYAAYQYSDTENIEEIIDILQSCDEVTKIQLSVWLNGGLNKAKAIDIPEITDDYMYKHRDIILAACVPYMEFEQDYI